MALVSPSDSTWVKSYALYKTDKGRMVINEIGKKIMDMSHIPIRNILKDENDPTLKEKNKIILRCSDT